MKKETFFEAFADIDERYVKEAEEICRPRRKRWLIAACVALIMIALPFVRLGIIRAGEDIIVVNEPTVLAMLDSDLEFVTYTEEESKALFESEFGMPLDELSDKLPESWNINMIIACFTPDASDDSFFDHFELGISVPSGAFAELCVGHGSNMMLSPYIMPDDDDKESRIDGTSVMIYEHGTVKDFAMENEYIATFEQDGVCYDIRMHADSVGELTELLSALIG